MTHYEWIDFKGGLLCELKVAVFYRCIRSAFCWKQEAQVKPKINIVIKLTYSIVVRAKTFCSRGRRFESQYGIILLDLFFWILHFFCFFFFFFFFSFDFFVHFVLISCRNSSQMLLNQTDVAVDEDLEKVIIPIDSSTEGTMSRATSTLPEKNYRNLQWNRCVSTAWMNAPGSECWKVVEITLFWMEFDEI